MSDIISAAIRYASQNSDKLVRKVGQKDYFRVTKYGAEKKSSYLAYGDPLDVVVDLIEKVVFFGNWISIPSRHRDDIFEITSNIWGEIKCVRETENIADVVYVEEKPYLSELRTKEGFANAAKSVFTRGYPAEELAEKIFNVKVSVKNKKR